MKTKLLFSALAIVVLFCGVGWGNPLGPWDLLYIKAYPPEISIISRSPGEDISGDTIYTMNGTATVNQGVNLPDSGWQTIFVLDSSNTSGFIINPEGDAIGLTLLDYPWGGGSGWGIYGCDSPPIRGYYIVPKYHYHNEMYGLTFTFEFAIPDHGWTSVILNEINANSSWGIGSNFVELYNKSDSAITLEGWQIVCDTIYNLPSDAIIPAHGYYVIDEMNFPTNFDLDFEADNIYLINADSHLVDQVGWSTNHGENVSFMRFPDGDVSYDYWRHDFIGYNDSSSYTFENGFPTRGAANRHQSPGFVAIGARADSVGEGTVRIHWTNPVWDTEFQASMVVRSIGSYVTNPAEGEIVYEGTAQSFTDQMVPAYQMFYYTVFAQNVSGTYSIPTQESQASIMFHGVGIDDNGQLPEKYFSLACYPNPFNAQTMVSFTLASESKATIAVYDITGRLVDIVAERSFPSGRNSIIWDAGKRPSGVYFCSIKVEDKTLTQKVVLLR